MHSAVKNFLPNGCLLGIFRRDLLPRHKLLRPVLVHTQRPTAASAIHVSFFIAEITSSPLIFPVSLSSTVTWQIKDTPMQAQFRSARKATFPTSFRLAGVRPYRTAWPIFLAVNRRPRLRLLAGLYLGVG